MYKNKTEDLFWRLLAVIVMLTLGITVWVLDSSMEAETFNKLARRNVSTWDAMWVQLRVIDTFKVQDDNPQTARTVSTVRDTRHLVEPPRQPQRSQSQSGRDGDASNTRQSTAERTRSSEATGGQR